jgi:hypothetical protein
MIESVIGSVIACNAFVLAYRRPGAHSCWRFCRRDGVC